MGIHRRCDLDSETDAMVFDERPSVAFTVIRTRLASDRGTIAYDAPVAEYVRQKFAAPSGSRTRITARVGFGGCR